jgi:hypothetical protein
MRLLQDSKGDIWVGTKGGGLNKFDKHTGTFTRYKYDKNITFSFHALNLTDETSRTFYTSTELDLGMVDAEGLPVLFDEGNAMDGDSDTSRTIREWKTGRQFRLTARINF